MKPVHKFNYPGFHLLKTNVVRKQVGKGKTKITTISPISATNERMKVQVKKIKKKKKSPRQGGFKW